PGGPGLLYDGHRPGRAAAVAGGPLGGDRGLRADRAGGLADHGAGAADDAADRLHDRLGAAGCVPHRVPAAARGPRRRPPCGPPAASGAAGRPAADEPVTAIRRLWDSPPEYRRYLAVTADGQEREVTVFDRDQQAVDVLYRIYRRVRVKAQVSRSAPLTMERA